MIIISALGVMLVIGLITGLANTAVGALKDAGKFGKVVNKLAGNTNDLKVAFIGAGILFMIMVLLIMSIHVVGAIRRDEAKQYLDNILVAPQRRTAWLTSRLALTFGVILATSVLGGLTLYAIAGTEHISLDFWKVMSTCICAVGSVGLLIGMGGLLYGTAPRFTMIAMYAVIGWSFIITLLESATKLNTVLLHSSLFEYTNFNLAQWPDWTTFVWMMAIGIALSALGIAAFNRRDIVSE
jgi:ABC-2 type transport system permease protein